MKVYFDLGFISVPSYGLMIALGVITANLIAMIVLKKYKLDFNDFVILEAYCFLGAFWGAKLLYLLVSWKAIEWTRMLEPSYFNGMMQGGFVFYGGLLGGLVSVLIAGRLHNISCEVYVRKFIFLIPMMHAFGRLGCFMAGCCYGIPYEGPGAVEFPADSYAITGVKLFPVQLVEAVLLLIIAIIILIIQLKYQCKYTIETYLVLYAIVRFALEYLRYDDERGILLHLSTSQWISILMIGIAVVLLWLDKRGMTDKK